jgi:DNA-binding response OmpR family regulator
MPTEAPRATPNKQPGSQDDAAEIDAMDAGADDYIRKPLEPARFVARVKAALRRPGSQ